MPDQGSTPGRQSRLAKNTVFNVIGQAAPMLAAFFTIPLLIKGLGTDRFGVLSIAWMMIGYLSLFDFGLGRALTQLVAEKLGNGRDEEIPALVWTTLCLMLCLGVVGTVLFAAASPWLTSSVLKIPASLQEESRLSFYILSATIPLVILTAGIRGVLEAYQRFAIINAIRVPMGLFTFVGPLVVLPFSKNLVVIVLVLVAGRLMAVLAHILACFGGSARFRASGYVIDRSVVKPLFRFGGWMTISNIISPLMLYLDRFFIGSTVSVTAVAYYSTPYELITKLLVVPQSLAGVLFPAFASLFESNRERTVALYRKGVLHTLQVILPACLVMIIFAHQGLEWWIGSEFASNSAKVLQYLAVGIVINSIAHVPFTLVQGAGRPDITARLHLIELPVYLCMLYYFVKTLGISGAALAWVTRVTLDTVLLFYISGRILPDTKGFNILVYLLIGVMFTVLLPLLYYW